MSSYRRPCDTELITAWTFRGSSYDCHIRPIASSSAFSRTLMKKRIACMVLSIAAAAGGNADTRCVAGNACKEVAITNQDDCLLATNNSTQRIHVNAAQASGKDLDERTRGVDIEPQSSQTIKQANGRCYQTSTSFYNA